jgi:CobQ-like glutamine amidotransferase family enzyme
LFLLINIFVVVKIIIPTTIIDYWDKGNIFILKKLWNKKKVVKVVKVKD